MPAAAAGYGMQSTRWRQASIQDQLKCFASSYLLSSPPAGHCFCLRLNDRVQQKTLLQPFLYQLWHL